MLAERGGRSSVGRAPGCGPGGRGFESRRPPLALPDFAGALPAGRPALTPAHQADSQFFRPRGVTTVKTGWKRGFRIAAVAGAALLIAGGAVAVAEAAHGGHGKAKKEAVKQAVRIGVHADVSLIRADGSTDAFAVDRGRVTASSATSLTLQRPDGKTVTLGVNTSTIVRGTIATGRPVLVVGGKALVFSRDGAVVRIFAGAGHTATG